MLISTGVNLGGWGVICVTELTRNRGTRDAPPRRICAREASCGSAGPPGAVAAEAGNGEGSMTLTDDAREDGRGGGEASSAGNGSGGGIALPVLGDVSGVLLPPPTTLSVLSDRLPPLPVLLLVLVLFSPLELYYYNY